jgi:hypothetical protein
MNCPHCGMAIPGKTNGSKDAASKLLAQDREHAQRAIEVLSRFTEDSRVSSGPSGLAEAVFAERLRLQVAIDTPVLLWSIYRRAEKRKAVDYREVAQ